MYLKLAYRFINKNKKLASYMCAALVIAGSLFISGGSLMNAYSGLSIANQEQSSGSWHLKLKSGCMENPEEFIASHEDIIEAIGQEEYLYSTEWTDGTNAFMMDIVAGDEKMFELSGINVYKGRLPQNENEIVLDYCLSFGEEQVYSVYNLGDEITFDVGKRMSENGVVYGDVDEGTVADTEPVTYKVVGFLDSGKGFYYGITSYTYRQTVAQPDRYWMRMTPDDVIGNIDVLIADCGLDESSVYNSEENGNVLMEDTCLAVENGPLYYRIYQDGFMGNNLTVKYGFYLLAVIIFIAGFLMVTNIYQLVLSKRNEDYAIFYALGMGEVGVFLISVLEGVILWMIAGIISVVISLMMNVGLMAIIKNVAFQNIRNMELQFSFFFVAVGVCVTFVMMLMAVSCNHLSIRKWSVRQMITGHAGYSDVKGAISKTMPLELRLSAVYAWRNKLKFVLTVLSMATSIILLYGLYCVGEELEVSELIDGNYHVYDFYAWGSDVWNIEKLKASMPYVRLISEVRSADIMVPNNSLPYTEQILSDAAFDVDFESPDSYIEVSFLSEEEYEEAVRPYLPKDMTYREWSDSGEALLADWYRGSDGELHHAFEGDGDIVIDYQGSDELLTPYESGRISCAYRVNVSEKVEVNYLTGILSVFIYLPLEKLPEYFDGSTYQFLYINAETGHEYELLEWLNANNEIYNYTVQDNITEKIGEENLRVIVLTCLSFVFGLLLIVCIVNIWNTTESNLYGRSYELGILEELGMSDIQKFMMCMPDLLAALMLAVLVSNGIAKIGIAHYFTKVNGIPIWLSIGVCVIYLCLILFISTRTIRKLNMISIRENQ